MKGSGAIGGGEAGWRAEMSGGQGLQAGTGNVQVNIFPPAPATEGRRPQAGGRRALRVFISSAPEALPAYRQAAVEVCHRLHVTPVYLDIADLQVSEPAEACRREVEDCDAFVLLLGWRYGARIPGLGVSQAEVEYQAAADLPHVPVLAFAASPGFSWLSPDVDAAADAESLARLVALVRSRGVTQRLAEIRVFREDLIVALGTLMAAHASANGANSDLEEAPAPLRAPAFYAVPAYAGSAPFTGRASQLAQLDDWGRSKDPMMIVEAIGGTGKSALTWQWAVDGAPRTVSRLSGRLWWSFYDGSASMTRFMQELLCYMTGLPAARVKQLGRRDLLSRVIAELKSQPYLIVLDGFERLLSAYHQFDPSKLHDEEVRQSQRSIIDPYAENIIRELTAAFQSAPFRSKVLISTRLMPAALQSVYGRRRPGVRHLRLPGLTDSDMQVLMGRLDVRGSGPAITRFFGPLENHPLLAGVVAGLVRDYRADPGGFDRWAGDPAGGAWLTVPDLQLTARRKHILQAALTGLQPGPSKLLGYIAVLPGSARWETLVGINPFRPDPPSPAMPDLAQLDAALKDLEDRGLLWWDRPSNTYDLHPIIRAHAYDQLAASDRFTANNRIRDHFQALPPENPDQAASVEDLTQTITILRALIGIDNSAEASQVWMRMRTTLLVRLGAYATVTELLTPLAAEGSQHVRASLAVACNFLGRYDEAVDINAARAVAYLRDGDTIKAQHCLSTLNFSLHAAGDLMAAQRCTELHAKIASITGRSDVTLHLARARIATALGKARQARKLIERARNGTIPQGFRWFRDNLTYIHLRLMLETGRSLTPQKIAAARQGARTQQFSCDLAALEADLFLRRKKFDEALSAALHHDQLCRNTGLEVAPARAALIYAHLGRSSEAAAAAEDAASRLTRLHPAQRPYYHLAQAFLKLDERAQAALYARDAYRQAWADGPRYSFRWDLARARHLLRAMNEPAPQPSIPDRTHLEFPREDEIRALIARL